jgi:predicted DNA-binding transcriptional regulator AlpA
VKLSERSSAWVESEVEAFMEARAAERDASSGAAIATESPYIRMGEVMRRTGLTASKIYDLVRTGEFPRWADLPKIASEWWRSDVEAWMSARESAATGSEKKERHTVLSRKR